MNTQLRKVRENRSGNVELLGKMRLEESSAGVVDDSNLENRSGVDLETLLRAQSGENKALNQLIEDNSGLIKHYARIFAKHLDDDEAIQVVMIGYWRAILTYRLGSGKSLANYAVYCVREELRRTINTRHILDVPDHLRNLILRIRKSPDFKRSHQELSEYVADKSSELKSCHPEGLVQATRVFVGEVYRLDAPKLVNFQEQLPEDQDVNKKLELNYLRPLLAHYIFQLSAKEKMIVEKIYLSDKSSTLDQISDEMGVCRNTVAKIKDTLLNKLAKIQELRLYCE